MGKRLHATIDTYLVLIHVLTHASRSDTGEIVRSIARQIRRLFFFLLQSLGKDTCAVHGYSTVGHRLPYGIVQITLTQLSYYEPMIW